MKPIVAAAVASPEGVAAAAAAGARWIAVAAGSSEPRDADPAGGPRLSRAHGIFLLTARALGPEPAGTAPSDAQPPAGARHTCRLLQTPETTAGRPVRRGGPGGRQARVEAVLWGPDGREVARQASVLGAQGAAATEAGPDLGVWDVDGWPCGILAGDDTRSPELARVLQLRGATCLWCVPAPPDASGTIWGTLSGVWQLVQQTQCFAIEADAPPGSCAIHAPCELTAGATGFLALAGGDAARRATRADASGRPASPLPDPAAIAAPDAPAVARLDPEALERLRRTYDLRGQLNPSLYRRHMERLCAGPGGPSGDLGGPRRQVDGPDRGDEGLRSGTGGPHRDAEEATAEPLRAEGRPGGGSPSGRPHLPAAARLAQGALAWRSRPAAVDRAVAALPQPRTGPPAGGPRVAAVQLRVRAYPNAAAFVAHVGSWTARAAAAGASLAVFPEDVATGLLGLIPGFERLAASALGTGSGAAGPVPAGGRAGPAERAGTAPADVLAFAGPYVERVYRRTFSALAARYRITVAAGSALLPRGGRVYNLGHVFGPDGRLAGVQPKLHLFPFEADWGIATGDDMGLWPTPAGRLAVAVCMDATYFEPFRIARALGAEVVAVPTANPEAYNPWKAMRGPWARAEENQVYAVQACLVGDLLGFHLSGRSAVYAPLALTARGDGVLAALEDGGGEGLVTAELDLDALARLRRERPLVVPRTVCRRWLPGLYGAGRPAGGVR